MKQIIEGFKFTLSSMLLLIVMTLTTIGCNTAKKCINDGCTHGRSIIELDYFTHYVPVKGDVFLHVEEQALFVENQQCADTWDFLGDVLFAKAHPMDEGVFNRVVGDTYSHVITIPTNFVFIYDEDAGEREYKIYHDGYLIGYAEDAEGGWYKIRYIDYSHLSPEEMRPYNHKI